LLRFGGPGTQRIERELASTLPNVRVLRLDADSAREGSAPGTTLRAFAQGKADILLGTQMVAKGLDFPMVTLVGVLDADVSLHLPDFRASERTWQLLVQVAGRAGRGTLRGEVLIQTCTPEHPAIAAASRLDERAFLAQEIAERREAGYPPFQRLASLRLSGRRAEDVEGAATESAERLREDEVEGVEVLGPAPQALARLRGQHRWHVLLKSGRSLLLHKAARRALELHADSRWKRTVRLIVDIDPVEVL
jgi:primosomal protein N' (replication factor Y)